MEAPGEQVAVELTVAMESLVERLWGLLREGSGVGLVGVRGSAGTGKTVLLNALRDRFEASLRSYDEEEQDRRKVIMLRLGREHVDIKSIQAEILNELEDDELHGSCEEEKELAENISRVLTEKKQCIFLFDDVWDELPLSTIGIPDLRAYNHCCKVVFATRNSELCSRADETIEIELDRSPDTWSIFLSGLGGDIAGGEYGVKSKLESILDNIVEACDGLPLALVNAGKAFSPLASKMEELATAMKREPWSVPAISENVLSVLKQSYDGLSSDAVRVCLMYFAMYPKETTILKEWFTDYWIGEGIITDFAIMDEAHEKRDRILGELEKAGLISDMKLQNMVRAMVSWANLAPPALLALPEADLTEAPVEEKWTSAKRISLVKNEIYEWPEEPSCPNLETLLLWLAVKNGALPSGFFRSMNSLKVLDLSRCRLVELPESFGELSTLQFLDLSFSTNLQSLPKEMANLQKLLFLSLDYCENLEVIPFGIFGMLSQLRILRMFATYSGWDSSEDGARIEELHNLTSLVELSIAVEDMESMQALLAMSHVRESLRSVGLRNLNGRRTLRLPQDLGEGLIRLQRIRIYDCSDLEEVVIDAKGPIENLRYLDIERLDRAKIHWGCTGQLEELKITKCEQIEELISEEHGHAETSKGPFLFPKLKLLYLVSLPSMRSICRVPLKFPSLQKLWVQHCAGVSKLPFAMHSGPSLETIWGSSEWWEGLDWGLGGDALKSHFQPFYTEWPDD